jgi:hypothetical protein
MPSAIPVLKTGVDFDPLEIVMALFSDKIVNFILDFYTHLTHKR